MLGGRKILTRVSFHVRISYFRVSICLYRNREVSVNVYRKVPGLACKTGEPETLFVFGPKWKKLLTCWDAPAVPIVLSLTGPFFDALAAPLMVQPERITYHENLRPSQD